MFILITESFAQNSKTPDSRLEVEQSVAKPESKARTDRKFCLKKQNSGNQPEFQSSIKKRTVNQTVCYFYKSKVLKSNVESQKA